METSRSIDTPDRNDNRSYDYAGSSFFLRSEYPIIAGWIPPNSSVIDLGCGNGSLMKYLLDQKRVKIEGIDNSTSGVDFCRKNGLDARLGEIDRPKTYAAYQDGQFDFAICNVTLQMVMYPEIIIRAMKRIARRQIISFPNFGYILNRLDLLLTGRMPRPQLFGYGWYNTGHIHQLSIADFYAACHEFGLKVIAQRHTGRPLTLANLTPRLFSRTAIYCCAPRD